MIVAVVALLALREPKGHVSGSRSTTVVTAPAPASGTRSPTASPTTPTSSATRPSGATSSGRTSTTGSTSQTQTSPSDATSLPLVVLNNSTTHGLAKQAAQRFEGGGWTVTHYGNLSGAITGVVSTCAYYDPATPGAKAAAMTLQAQYPTIKRVKRKFAELPAGPIVVVLTSDYSST